MKTVNSLKEVNLPTERPGTSSGRFSLAVPLLLGSLFAVPLLINPGVFESADQTYLYPRLWLIYGIVLPSALLLLTNWPVAWAKVRGRVTLLALLLGWMVLSVLLTGAGWHGWWGQTDRADGVLMHGVYAVLVLAGWQWAQYDPGWRPRLAAALLLGGGLTALGNVLQQLHIAGISNANAFTGVIATPFGGTLGHRGYLGGAMAILLPAGLWLWPSLAPKYHRWGGLALTLMVWALLGSFTRGAWLAGMVGLGWYALVARPKAQLLWPIVAGMLLFGATSAMFHNGRALSLNGENGQALTNDSGRGVLWKSARLGIQQKPVLGWGTPSLIQVLNTRPTDQLLAENGTTAIRSARKLQSDPTTPPRFAVIHTNGKYETVSLGGNVDKVHNEYLDYALTYGIPATIFFVVLLALAIWAGSWVVPGIAASLVAFAAYVFTWPEVVRFAPIAWFLLGIALAHKGNRDKAAS